MDIKEAREKFALTVDVMSEPSDAHWTLHRLCDEVERLRTDLAEAEAKLAKVRALADRFTENNILRETILAAACTLPADTAECSQCAACDACRGECGECPYADQSRHEHNQNADDVLAALDSADN